MKSLPRFREHAWLPGLKTPASSDVTLMDDPHTAAVRAFYDRAPEESAWTGRAYRRCLAHYFNLMIPPDASVLEVGCGSGELLEMIHAASRTGVDLSPHRIELARKRLPDADFHVQAGEQLDLPGRYDVIIISDTLNLATDVQRLLEHLLTISHPGTRLIVNFQNTLWRPLLAAARAFGLHRPQPRSSWLASSDVRNLLQLSGWLPIARQGRILVPFQALGLGPVINRVFAPLLGWFCLTIFMVARPPSPKSLERARVSVVIPARNEAGNIAAAISRTPEMGAGTELIFVEGNSRDATWEAIQRGIAENPDRRILALKQPGSGKGDAVRAGFAAATGDVLMILDADLTMPPEELPKFFDVIAGGRAEFANGVRLIYPMDDRAMPFLNLCANKAFSIAFTWLLGQPVKDTLCGTKALSREHYAKIAAGRAWFGDFDPFGDFDLLFGAARLNLKIADVPIRYRERVYGESNIHRWSHGWLLIRMVAFAARKLKFV